MPNIRLPRARGPLPRLALKGAGVGGGQRALRVTRAASRGGAAGRSSRSSAQQGRADDRLFSGRRRRYRVPTTSRALRCLTSRRRCPPAWGTCLRRGSWTGCATRREPWCGPWTRTARAADGRRRRRPACMPRPATIRSRKPALGTASRLSSARAAGSRWWPGSGTGSRHDHEGQHESHEHAATC
jgi:hypothetical protein